MNDSEFPTAADDDAAARHRLANPDVQHDPVEDFWAHTALEPWNVAAFWNRLQREPPSPPIIDPHTTTSAGQPLPRVADRFQEKLAARHSEREFSDDALTRSELARLLAAAGVDASGRRIVPQAGGFDSVHLYVLARRIEGCEPGSTWRYNHRTHELAPIDTIDDNELRTMTSIGPEDPAAVVVFIISPSMTLARYGQHGSRFGLQEVGHAMQNLLLRMTNDGLAGYPMGGLVDRLIIDALDLGSIPVRVGGGLAVGHPPRQHARRSRILWSGRRKSR